MGDPSGRESSEKGHALDRLRIPSGLFPGGADHCKRTNFLYALSRVNSDTQSVPPTARRRLPWFPIIVVALGAVAVIYVQSRPEMEQNMKMWQSMAAAVLVILLNLLWLLFTPRFSWKKRLAGLAVFLLIGFGMKLTLRVDGTVNGTGLPRFTWKWSAVPELAGKPLQAADATAVADKKQLAQAANIPQFFGPNRDGVVIGANLARDWKASSPKELWRQPIGAGWSAFAVVDGRAYTQEQRGDEEMVTCYDLFTGKLRWAHTDKTCFTQWQAGTGPHATPTVADGRIYSYGATGLLNCLDAATGRQIWQRSVLTENNVPNNEWGASSSPLLVDEKVIVTGGNNHGPTLFAFQRDTGAPLWKSGDDRASYASPIVATLAGRRVIVSNNARGFSACDPVTGAVLLDCAWGGDKWPKASQPVIVGEDRVFVSAGYGYGSHLFQIKAEAEDKLSATELWHNLRMKTQFNTPAVRDGHAYGLDDGRLECLDLATGERLWKEGNFGAGQSLLVDDLVIVQSESGPVYLTAAKPAGYEELGRIDALSSKTWNHPTLAGRYLLLRNDREAVCYELPVMNQRVAGVTRISTSR